MSILALTTTAYGAPMKLKEGQTGTWTVKGDCSRLVVRNENLTTNCNGEVVRTRFPDGTVTFRFSDGKNWLIFRTREASTRLWQGYRTVLDIDGVSFGEIGSDPDFIAKKSSSGCKYGAPYYGQASISCMIIVDFRMWAATVHTDGRLPVPSSEYIPPAMSSPSPTTRSIQPREKKTDLGRLAFVTELGSPATERLQLLVG